MDNKQAKFILHSYRAGGQDADDPQFAEALQQTEHDPALAAWLAEEGVFDTVISRKLRDFPAPPELGERIKASRGFHRKQGRRSLVVQLAWAAALVFLGIVAAARWVRPPQPAVDFRTAMIATVANGIKLDYLHDDPVEVQHWLARNQAWPDSAFPSAFKQRPTLGCRSLSWNGHPVALICFRVDDGRTLHLFVAARSTVPSSVIGDPARYAMEGNWATASWAQGEHVYLLAALGGADLVRRPL